MTTTGPGTAAEEAAKLMAALGEWAATATSAQAGTPGGGRHEAPHDAAAGDDSAQTGTAGGQGHSASPECSVCPVCQLLAAVRRTQPETFGHLAEASAALVAAARSLLEAGPSPARASGLQRIDLDGPVP